MSEYIKRYSVYLPLEDVIFEKAKNGYWCKSEDVDKLESRALAAEKENEQLKADLEAARGDLAQLNTRDIRPVPTSNQIVNHTMKSKLKEIRKWFKGAYDGDGEIRHDWERIRDSSGRTWVEVPMSWFENAPIRIKEDKPKCPVCKGSGCHACDPETHLG